MEDVASATRESRIRFDERLRQASDAPEAIAQRRSLVAYIGLLDLLAEQVIEHLELTPRGKGMLTTTPRE